jgi:hypothetical protein
VFRVRDGAGRIARDVLGLAEEQGPGQALLEPVLTRGALVCEPDALEDLDRIRARAREQLESLPPPGVLGEEPLLVLEPSEKLRALATRAEARLRAQGDVPA